MELITREEMYLAAAAGYDVTPPEPVTRKEFFLAKMAGMDVNTPAVFSRGEMFLQEVAQRSPSGGVSSNVLIVDVTLPDDFSGRGECEVTLSTSGEEIYSAYVSGRHIYFNIWGSLMQLSACEAPTFFSFCDFFKGHEQISATSGFFAFNEGRWIGVFNTPSMYDVNLFDPVFYINDRFWKLKIDDSGNVTAEQFDPYAPPPV